MKPDLANAATGQIAYPRHYLGPAFFILHLACNQSHDVVEDNQIDVIITVLADDVFDRALPLHLVERFQVRHIFPVQCEERIRHRTNASNLFVQAFFQYTARHLAIDVENACTALPSPLQEIYS